MLMAVLVAIWAHSNAQKKAIFRKLPLDSLGVRAYEMLALHNGSTLFTSSSGMWRLKGHDLFGMLQTVGISGIKNLRSYLSEASIRAMAESPD